MLRQAPWQVAVTHSAASAGRHHCPRTPRPSHLNHGLLCPQPLGQAAVRVPQRHHLLLEALRAQLGVCRGKRGAALCAIAGHCRAHATPAADCQGPRSPTMRVRTATRSLHAASRAFPSPSSSLFSAVASASSRTRPSSSRTASRSRCRASSVASADARARAASSAREASSEACGDVRRSTMSEEEAHRRRTRLGWGRKARQACGCRKPSQPRPLFPAPLPP